MDLNYLVFLVSALDQLPRFLGLHQLIAEARDVQEVRDGVPLAAVLHL